MTRSSDPYQHLPTVPTFPLRSEQLRDGAPLPLEQRSAGVGGQDVSPQLSWSGAPAGTKSYAVTMYDADAPTPSGFWHWALFDVPARITSLPRGGAIPEGAVALPNDARMPGYLGAAPPKGTGEHRYFIVVHALDVETLPMPKDGTPAYLSFNLLGHTLARAVLIATASAD